MYIRQDTDEIAFVHDIVVIVALPSVKVYCK